MYHYFLVKIAEDSDLYILRVKRYDYPILINARREVKAIMMEFTKKDFIVRPIVYDCLLQELVFADDIAHFILN